MSTRDLVVIACGAAKAPQAAPAGQLYVSDTFRHFLKAATAVAGLEEAEVVILSARHGLVGVHEVIAPYDTTMADTEPDAYIAELVDQLISRAPRVVSTMLPGIYWNRLHAAASHINEHGSEEDPWIELRDLYECGFGPQFGVGYQRGVAAKLLSIS